MSIRFPFFLNFSTLIQLENRNFNTARCWLSFFTIKYRYCPGAHRKASISEFFLFFYKVIILLHNYIKTSVPRVPTYLHNSNWRDRFVFFIAEFFNILKGYSSFYLFKSVPFRYRSVNVSGSATCRAS